MGVEIVEEEGVVWGESGGVHCISGILCVRGGDALFLNDFGEDLLLLLLSL